MVLYWGKEPDLTMQFTCVRTRMSASFIGRPLADACSIAIKIQQAGNREPRSQVSLHASIPACLHASPSLSNLGRACTGWHESRQHSLTDTLTAVRAMEVITGVGVGQFYWTNVAQNGLAESPALL